MMIWIPHVNDIVFLFFFNKYAHVKNEPQYE